MTTKNLIHKAKLEGIFLEIIGNSNDYSLFFYSKTVNNWCNTGIRFKKKSEINWLISNIIANKASWI